MIIIYLLMALLGSAATIFALQNREPVEIWFLDLERARACRWPWSSSSRCCSAPCSLR